MLEKRLSYFLAGLGLGVGISALVAPRSGRDMRGLIAGKVGRGKELLAKSGARVRDSATQLLDRANMGFKRVDGALTAATEAGKSTLSAN